MLCRQSACAASARTREISNRPFGPPPWRAPTRRGVRAMQLAWVRTPGYELANRRAGGATPAGDEAARSLFFRQAPCAEEASLAKLVDDTARPVACVSGSSRRRSLTSPVTLGAQLDRPRSLAPAVRRRRREPEQRAYCPGGGRPYAPSARAVPDPRRSQEIPDAYDRPNS
jgi:hypothetical protein